MSQKSDVEAPRPNYRTHNISIVGLLIVIIVLLVRSFYNPTSPYRDAVTKPDGIDNWACTGEGGGLNCLSGEKNGHTLSLSNVPTGVTPYFVPISAKDVEGLKRLPKEGFTCLDSIRGNLVFYDDNTKKLVTTFDTPVVLQINFTNGDLAKVHDCKPELKDDELWKNLVPVYLFMPGVAPSVNIWKPFQSYKIELSNPDINYGPSGDPNAEIGTITIEFMFWGDDPKGFGSPKSS
jgi:hypothetical protein